MTSLINDSYVDSDSPTLTRKAFFYHGSNKNHESSLLCFIKTHGSYYKLNQKVYFIRFVGVMICVCFSHFSFLPSMISFRVDKNNKNSDVAEGGKKSVKKEAKMA